MNAVKINKTNVLAGALALTAVLATGCANVPPTRQLVRGHVNHDAMIAYAEPNPFEALVMAEPGLGASDALGHQVFVSNSDTRFALGHMVWQMAAAEDPSIKLDEVFGDMQYLDLPQGQAIVSAEEMRSRRLRRDAVEPTAQPVDIETVGVPTEEQYERFEDGTSR